MTSTLKQKSLSAFVWSLIDRSAQFVFLAISILIARMLSPSDYGMVAVLLLFSLLANVFQDSGFSSALIRKIDATEEDYNTVFYFNLSVATFLYIVLFFSAPLIARFYSIPELLPLSRFVFLSFFFNALSMVQNVQLTKSLQYKKLALINILSTGTSYFVTIALVYLGATYWAIAAQLVIVIFIRMLLLWFLNSWIPKFIFSVSAFKELYKFSINIFFASILGTITIQIIPAVIGKFISIVQGGYYYQAVRLNSVGVSIIDGTVLTVGYSILSNIPDDNTALLKRAFQKILRLTAFICFPIFLGTFIIAEPVIQVCLTEKWLLAVPALQVLAITAIFNSLNSANINFLRKIGVSKTILKLEIFRNLTLLSLISICIVFQLEFFYILLCICFVAFCTYGLYALQVFKRLDYTILELTKDILPYAGIMTFTACTAYSLRYFIHTNWILLIAQVTIAASLYLGICYLLGSKLMKESLEIIKTKVFGKVSSAQAENEHLPKRDR